MQLAAAAVKGFPITVPRSILVTQTVAPVLTTAPTRSSVGSHPTATVKHTQSPAKTGTFPFYLLTLVHVHDFT